MRQPLLTCIVSTYGAERLMRECLEDLVSQTLFDEMEVLVIDSGSPEGESAICREFAQRHPQIRHWRTEREPLYATWNRAIPLARGKYLTNANTDDRHRSDFAQVMVQALEECPDAALAYADQLVSHTENETYAQCASRGAQRHRWPDFTPEDLMLRCITGSQPVWRRCLHDTLGLFDTRYRIAADYDMWLRFAGRHRLLHVPQALGVFYDAPQTMSRANRLQMEAESLAIRQIHMQQPPWKQSAKFRQQLAAELFGIGYRHLSRANRNGAAEPFLREAIRLDPTNLRFLKTYVIRCILGIAPERPAS